MQYLDTYYYIPSVFHILIDMHLRHHNCATLVVVTSNDGKVQRIGDTAQRYENESKKGVHDPDERREGRKNKGEKRKNESW